MGQLTAANTLLSMGLLFGDPSPARPLALSLIYKNIYIHTYIHTYIYYI